MRTEPDMQTVTAPREPHSAADAPGGGKVEPVLIGESRGIREIRAAIDLVSPSDTPVIITGESGTGKDVVARLIHAKGPRAGKPFITVNCAALPRDVIENELFGHDGGAFAGAPAREQGCFELADGGTLFIDELTDMSPDIQARLLRAIEQRVLRRSGGKEEIPVDVRALAATNRNLRGALQTGALRADLYYRFSVIELAVPPLRERREDIPLLVEHFLSQHRAKQNNPDLRFSRAAVGTLCAHDWPGNVRELRNVVERSILVSRGSVMECSLLPTPGEGDPATTPFVTMPVGITIEEAQRRFVMHTLQATGQNKSEAARLLGMTRRGLQKKLHRLQRRNEPLGSPV